MAGGKAGGAEGLMHIGRVADEVGLSLRTIRYYEEIGLVLPSGRTAGGFRQYSRRDVERLMLIKRMKPLGYPLEEMARVLSLLDALWGRGDGTLTAADAVNEMADYSEAVQKRIMDLRLQVEYAQEFRDRIIAALDRHREGEQLEGDGEADVDR